MGREGLLQQPCLLCLSQAYSVPQEKGEREKNPCQGTPITSAVVVHLPHQPCHFELRPLGTASPAAFTSSSLLSECSSDTAQADTADRCPTDCSPPPSDQLSAREEAVQLQPQQRPQCFPAPPGHALSNGGRKHAISGIQVRPLPRKSAPTGPPDPLNFTRRRDGSRYSRGSWRRPARHRRRRSRRLPFLPNSSRGRSDSAGWAPRPRGQAIPAEHAGSETLKGHSEEEAALLQDWISSGNTSGWYGAGN